MCMCYFPARYQNELAGVDTELLAERFYYQALSVAPQIGKWTTVNYEYSCSSVIALISCENR